MNKSELLSVFKTSFFILAIMFILQFIIIFVEENFQITDYLISSFDSWYKHVFGMFFAILIGKYVSNKTNKKTS